MSSINPINNPFGLRPRGIRGSLANPKLVPTLIDHSSFAGLPLFKLRTSNPLIFQQHQLAPSMGTGVLCHSVIAPARKGCMVLTISMDSNAHLVASSSQSQEMGAMEKQVQPLTASIQELTCQNQGGRRWPKAVDAADLDAVATITGCGEREERIVLGVGEGFCPNLISDKLYQNTFSTEEKRHKFLKWRIQFLEKSIRNLDFSPIGISSIVQVNDFKNSFGIGRRELWQATKLTIQLFQDNYPEFLAKQAVDVNRISILEPTLVVLLYDRMIYSIIEHWDFVMVIHFGSVAETVGDHPFFKIKINVFVFVNWLLREWVFVSLWGKICSEDSLDNWKFWEEVQEHCGYFEWIDPPTCVRGTEIAAKIIEKSSKLEKSVLIAHEREVVARGMEARAREKEMMTRKKEKMYMHALVMSWCLIVVLLVSFWYSGQAGKMKTLSLP
uniref:CRAL-TRIO domain-containing protein n=1 Tax=Fagus sylvatica TaxID=28930 RepID=A0A2N9H3M5_FAGSY